MAIDTTIAQRTKANDNALEKTLRKRQEKHRYRLKHADSFFAKCTWQIGKVIKRKEVA